MTLQQSHTTDTELSIINNTLSFNILKPTSHSSIFLISNHIFSLKNKESGKTRITHCIRMATITSAAVTIPSFTGLKAGVSSSKAMTVRVATPVALKFAVKASLKDFGVAVAATAASVMLASNALAIDVKLGGDDGSLVFIPESFVVESGEKITFSNNAGFPHNVVFDEDEIPAGVDASKISMSEEDLLNAKGETYAVTLKEKGTYSFYCSPHQGAGMVGKVTVK